ncbi:MAG: putative TrmH family tRNA/rRNA methyltransferase [bacterium ADurb.Bin236]|nr:MAG: putative TrmH family tRNA/rRNA methyltransferase [bacterium ADurb.Bin236]HPN94047.1 23S rRNA (guanosine(2251)-2'-O)-methyltransferase RlmB [bacterium]
MMRLTDKNAIVEALKAGRVVSLHVGAAARSDERAARIAALAREAGIPVRDMPVKGRSPIEAVCNDFEYATLESLMDAREESGGLIVALDHVQDPMNLGAILRTAAAAGAIGAVIERKRSCEVTPVVYETSCGGAERLLIVKVANLRQALSTMKERGCWVAGTDERAKDVCHDADMSGVSVLVMGGEGEGMSRITREECDYLVRVPTVEEFPSLNVSVAAGVLIFETMRQKRALGDKKRGGRA